MKTKLFTFTMTIFAMLLIISCSDDSDNSEDPDVTKDCKVQNFKFIEDGNELIYEFAGLTCLFNDRLKTSFIAESENVVFGINECYLSTEEANKTELSRVRTTECSGNIYILDDDGEFADDSFRYKGIRALGESWTNVDANNIKSTYTVIALDVSVTVPEGTHSCDKITYFQEGAINVDTFYFNNEVGFVKYDGIFQSYELLEKNF